MARTRTEPVLDELAEAYQGAARTASPGPVAFESILPDITVIGTVVGVPDRAAEQAERGTF